MIGWIGSSYEVVTLSAVMLLHQVCDAGSPARPPNSGDEVRFVLHGSNMMCNLAVELAMASTASTVDLEN